jgi:hypothetical protein
VVDDEDLLARWSMGLLDAAEHEAIIHHLAECPECRELVALMVRNGALVLPEVEEPEPEPAPAPATSAGRSGRQSLVLLALAAAVLIAVGLPLLWPTADTRLGRSLALTEFDFELDGGSYARTRFYHARGSGYQWEARVEGGPTISSCGWSTPCLLLEYHHTDDAIEQFRRSSSGNQDNTDALVGIGVALYEQAYKQRRRSEHRPAVVPSIAQTIPPGSPAFSRRLCGPFERRHRLAASRRTRRRNRQALGPSLRIGPRRPNRRSHPKAPSLVERPAGGAGVTARDASIQGWASAGVDIIRETADRH